jgi:hypothetical protein
MTGHFTTMCGCERWMQIERAMPIYKFPIMRPAIFNPLLNQDERGVTVAAREFQLMSIDHEHGLCEYREIPDRRLFL